MNIPAEVLPSLAVITTGLFGFWAKQKFVTKDECNNGQSKCSTAICKKIDELKVGQVEVFKYMRENERLMGRIEQYMSDNGGDK